MSDTDAKLAPGDKPSFEGLLAGFQPVTRESLEQPGERFSKLSPKEKEKYWWGQPLKQGVGTYDGHADDT